MKTKKTDNADQRRGTSQANHDRAEREAQEEQRQQELVRDTKPVGRMPERSEAISGDESKGLEPISAAQSEEVNSAKLGKITKAKIATDKPVTE